MLVAPAVLDAAGEWARRAEEAADGLGIDGRTADALRARAAVALAAGDPELALELSAGAVEAAERAGLPIDAARARTLGGRALGASGETSAAVAELKRARDELTAISAGHYADEAARELRRLGARVTRPQRAASERAGSSR